MFDFVQEMGDLKLARKGVGVTLQNSSLVFICDAKTWSQKKKINISETGLFLCADQVFDFVQEMGDLKLTCIRSWCHLAKLFLSLDL